MERSHFVLTAAATMGATALVSALLHAGADISATGMFGETPLHTAAWFGHSSVVALLLAWDAPIDPLDGELGTTPFQWAVHGSSPHAWTEKRDQTGAARLLAEAGAAATPGSLRQLESAFAPLPPEMRDLFADLGMPRS